jgi:hypothetical protein
VRSSQDGAAISSSAILGGAARGAIWQPVAILFGDNKPAVLADIRLWVEGAAGSPAAEAAIRCGEAGEVGVMGRRARARGGAFER